MLLLLPLLLEWELINPMFALLFTTTSLKVSKVITKKLGGGRDGGEGYCLAFYAYKDIEKLEKFMSGKPVAEQEIGLALLNEMIAYAETSISRRKFILHYFGESFDSEKGDPNKMDDNVRFPKTKVEAKEELLLLLNTIEQTREQFKAKEIVKTLVGQQNAIINSHHTAQLPIFGQGNTRMKLSGWPLFVKRMLQDI